MDVPPFLRRVKSNKLSDEERRLIKAARKASENAWVKISGFSVGAALETEEGKIFLGCNVESEALSPTSCAEVVACDKAVSEGHRKFKRVAIYAHDREGRGRDLNPVSPCGRCRQKLLEFSDADIIMASKNSDEVWTCRLSDLLPLHFRLQTVLSRKK